MLSARKVILGLNSGKTWAREQNQDGGLCSKFPHFSIWKEILLPLAKLTLTSLEARVLSLIIYINMEKQGSSIASKRYLVCSTFVLDDAFIKMGWVYTPSIILHRSVPCLLYYVMGHSYIRTTTMLYKKHTV